MSPPTVTAFRGAPPGAGPPPAQAGLPPREPADVQPPAVAPLLPPLLARVLMFFPLAAFGGLHWMAMLDPGAPERAGYGVAAGVLVAAGLLLAGRLPAALRAAVAAATIAGGLAAAIVGAGAADELLGPGRWDELAAGIWRGAEALPGARVPYRGLDEWLQLVIALGGTLLVVLAAALAFWPRRRGAGMPVPALVLLVTLYAVPAVALIFEDEFGRGAVLTLLVIGFLRLERVRRRDATGAGAVAALTVAAALAVAPALDGLDPWWDYETWALSAAGSNSTTFAWDHDYGPLDWPRDGRELLRVRSKARTYWKADQLDVFEGRRWVRATDYHLARERPAFLTDGIELARLEKWTFDIRVSIRALRSETFVAAGTLVDEGIEMPRRGAFSTTRPGIYRTSRDLRRGDVYDARVYVPQPSVGELRAASANYAGYPLERYTELALYGDGGGRAAVRFPRFHAEPVLAADGRPAGGVLERSNLARVWALAQRLREQADTPYEYVRSVERLLSRDYSYSEQPPAASETLNGFLFETRVGYCQQFSGAMALLLRMGGIPVRVATGFSPGSHDRDTGEYIVRDVDAHSWVEVWFTGIGWVPFDPTPTSSPARSQADDTSASAALGGVRDIGIGPPNHPGGGPLEESRPWWHWPGGIAALAALALAARGVWRRRRLARARPTLELERALRITGARPAGGVTLSVLERRFAAVPPAAGYVRALRAQRFAAAPHGPTAAQRRGLRRALGRGRGLVGRLRAWWALPPRLPRRSG